MAIDTDKTIKMDRGAHIVPLYGTASESIVDGPGLRYTVFVQGCPHRCHGCHNPDSQPISGGHLTDLYEIAEKIFDNPLISGITLSGGEPFLYAADMAALAHEAKAHGLNVWVYSGFTFEELSEYASGHSTGVLESDGVSALLEAADVLVDGQFIEALKDIDLEWRGSSNQRIIDLSKLGAAANISEH